jgi:hypothetical protein
VKGPAFFERIWRSEKGLSVLLGLLAVSIFILNPLMAQEVAGTFLFEILLAALLLSGVVILPRRGPVRMGTLALVLLTLVVRWTAKGSSSLPLTIAGHSLTIVSVALLAAMVLIQVFREGPITGYRIQGSIAAYLLLGLTWTEIYDLIYVSVPGAFKFASAADEVTRHRHDLLYYSFVTLTTMGYGDIVPAHPIARSLAIAEALVGQLYPAILIARLVSMQISSGRKA